MSDTIRLTVGVAAWKLENMRLGADAFSFSRAATSVKTALTTTGYSQAV
ncbi:hypothetical protein MHY01S_11700 [Meiothermus hypogaeus NBRC 106114]|uniref:Uncharacterized protein n=1 Tax=Meiothermus hypogaeus NBRC 106114 TaxID=1227553 RepID=A0A511R066_9DEIN|nr:hypothetical protein MHY01S_11700 [Meiothermus hypogaeus NBRC 106114]